MTLGGKKLRRKIYICNTLNCHLIPHKRHGAWFSEKEGIRMNCVEVCWCTHVPHLRDGAYLLYLNVLVDGPRDQQRNLLP